MTIQLDLSAFSEKTTSIDKSMKDFRSWNHLILNWEIEYQGYSRGDHGDPEGYIDFHVIVEIKEALVNALTPKRRKRLKKPGYKLTVIQNMAFEEEEWESYISQRRFSDMISFLDLYELINARVISMGRYGKTREIMSALPDKVIQNLL